MRFQTNSLLHGIIERLENTDPGRFFSGFTGRFLSHFSGE
ncbi:hypothetical protein B4098_1849 [Heyndrickxia coagulans]|uniref:Uncharacterized protein n=1 Tax=Heyndrickxia coagulans TaxID=1398 RepID=A0A150JZ09_HEYCO|nr:hypothetical protein B4098_1849 [Heyndrickxia coagulans]